MGVPPTQVANADAKRTASIPARQLYHFKSKEGLLHAVIGELHSRLPASFVEMMSANTRSRQASPLKQFWLWAIREENLTHWRLHYEFNVLAMQNPAEYGRHMKGTSLEWQKLALEALSEPIRSTTMATLDRLYVESSSTPPQKYCWRECVAHAGAVGNASRGSNARCRADVTVAQTPAKELGVALQIVPTTWKSMTGDFKAGRFDIAMSGVSITDPAADAPVRAGGQIQAINKRRSGADQSDLYVRSMMAIKAKVATPQI
jgi:AcrR family transcriptional regulator